MNIFIAGPRVMSKINDKVAEKINNIINKEYTILVGDANGIDKAVQCYLSEKKYANVKVYATKGLARNNVGNWDIKKVDVSKDLKGFDFYAAKDYEMAKDADYGFMIWNAKSKGTLNNLINLLCMKKNLIIYFSPEKALYTIKSLDELKQFVKKCNKDTQKLFLELLNKKNIQIKLDI